MRTFLRHRLHRLRAQLTLAILVGFLGIGIAIGIPVVLLISQQSSSHAQRLLDQAAVASRAFIDGEKSDIQSLALLISQRPTLVQLLDEQDASALESYLETLRKGANLDLILICTQADEPGAVAGNLDSRELCSVDSPTGFTTLSRDNELQLYATGDIFSGRESEYRVVIGKRAISILEDLQEETGLLYLLMQGDEALVSSQPAMSMDAGIAGVLQEGMEQNPNRSLQQRSVSIEDHRYILSSLEVEPVLRLRLISALNVDNQIAVQQSLSSSLAMGLFFIMLVASVLGIWLSQRISQPIVRLANAAAAFRQGNLDSPISVQSTVWEIDQLSNTLEDGRVALQHSLQQLHAEKAWIEHLLNSIVEATITLDNQNRITFASAAISKITGEDSDQIVGQKIDAVFLPLEGDMDLNNQLPAIGQQRRISVRLRNGQERLLSISKSKLVPPEASSATRALVIRDVSNEEYIHRLLGDFMANITHEFRTPLAALEASSELLLDNFDSLSHAELKELLVALNLGIIDLQTLIDNLIEAASIEAGRFKVSLQPVLLEAILNDAVGMIQPLAEKYSLQLVAQPVEEPILVMADRRRTVQALVNLLSNAVKHSPEHGVVQVTYTVKDAYLKMEVSDAGSGVAAGQRGNLFRRFAHLDSPNERARRGAGLGLSVVKEIVEAQQGEVGVTELPEGGTSFWFTLPLVNESVQK